LPRERQQLICFFLVGLCCDEECRARARVADWRHYLPLGLTVLLPTPTPLTGIVIAAAAMLSGFLALRILLFKAAVYEPIANDIIGNLGLSMLRS